MKDYYKRCNVRSYTPFGRSCFYFAKQIFYDTKSMLFDFNPFKNDSVPNFFRPPRIQDDFPMRK
jgi:hypothetical protein